MGRHRVDWNPPPKRLFPHVDSQWLAEAPPACDRCGNPWQRVDEGYRCVICSRRWRAADCLRAQRIGEPAPRVDKERE